MQLREVSIGKARSTFRVELFQNAKASIFAPADILCDLALPGRTMIMNWKSSPPPSKVDLSLLESSGYPDWAWYHIAFHPDGSRRGMAYVKDYIPCQIPSPVKFVEQWIAPGWDCDPVGCRDEKMKEARWTNDAIQIVVDSSLPIQENFWLSPMARFSVGSIAATLGFAARQRKAMEDGHANWRELSDDGSLPEDGSKVFKNAMINVTLSMTTETKKKLPREGFRCLYIRTEAKRLEGSWMDLEILLFDEAMDLVAVSHQVAWVVTGIQKAHRGSSL